VARGPEFAPSSDISGFRIDARWRNIPDAASRSSVLNLAGYALLIRLIFAGFGSAQFRLPSRRIGRITNPLLPLRWMIMSGQPTSPRLAGWRILRSELKEFAKNAVSLAARIGADSNDDYELRLKKLLLVLGSILFLIGGLCWGVMYFAFGARLAAAIPFSYGVFSLLSVIWFGVTRRYRFFRFSQLILVLLLPFLLMLALMASATRLRSPWDSLRRMPRTRRAA